VLKQDRTREILDVRLRTKITGGILATLALAVGVVMLVLSHNSTCPEPSGYSGPSPSMAAVTARCYGSPDVLEFGDVEKPVPADNEVLVKVHSASVNPLDWHYLRGTPYVIRLFAGIGAPKDPRVGVDYSGTVEAIGNKVTRFRIGDEVFGGRSGAFAEYLVIPEDGAIVHKPANVSFESAATVGIAGVTALQALRDHGKLEAGDRVLINGASGGVGTFAVQIAAALGAEVTGVCSTRNLEMVRLIGAHHVIDYTREDYTESGKQYDLIVDMVGNHSLTANRDVLVDDGRLVLVGGAKGNWIAPFVGSVKAPLLSRFVDQELISMLAKMSPDDLKVLAGMMHKGELEPVVGRRFPLRNVAAAIRHSEGGHARGKIIIEIDR
jgi:NADPH:quinone reductase-like Zn-dependent oxidoreductase